MQTLGSPTQSKPGDVRGTARVIREVEFRYGNLPAGGNARVEILGQT